MTYTTNLSQSSCRSIFLAVLKPKRYVTAWTHTSGTIYHNHFDYGHVSAVKFNSTTLTESSGLGSNTFYYDAEAGTLSINAGTDPAGDLVTVTYELYAGTQVVNTGRIPTSASSRQVAFLPLIIDPPKIVAKSADTAFGYVPTQSSQVTLNNCEHWGERHAYDSSFSQADIDFYHCLGNPADPDDCKLVYSCLGTSLDVAEDTVTVNMVDRNDILSNQYRPNGTTDFYTLAKFPAVDPAFVNRPVRKIYGRVNGVSAVNIDGNVGGRLPREAYRTWAIMEGSTNLPSHVYTNTGGSPPYDWLQLDTVAGLEIGDTLALYRGTSGNIAIGQGLRVNDINVGANQIKHCIGTGLDWGSGSGTYLLQKCFVRNGTRWNSDFSDWSDLWYGRDYIVYTDGTNNICGVHFFDNFESDIAYLKLNDQIFFDVLGHSNAATIGGSAFGSNGASGELNQGVVVLYDVLKAAGIPESRILTSSFQAVQATNTDTVAFCIPKNISEDYPVLRDLVGTLLQTLLLKLSVDFDGKWKVTQTGPMGAATKTISKMEIADGSFSFSADYSQILSMSAVEYGYQEMTERQDENTKTAQVQSSSTYGTYLHGVTKQNTVESLHFDETQAATLAERLGYIFGDRQGRLTLTTKNRFMDVNIGDVIAVERSALPGFAYDVDTSNTRSFVVTGVSKGLDSVELELDDQKGIEDNSGSW